MNGLPKPCYVMSEPHLSGYRVVLGYETLTEAQDAQSALAASPPAREEAPAEGAGDTQELAVLLDNLVIAQSLSRELREAATDQARSYLYDLRNRTSEPEAGEDYSSLIAARCVALPGKLIDCPVCKAVDNERDRQDALRTSEPAREGWTGRKCPRCSGTGRADEFRPCTGCGGTGEGYGQLNRPAPATADKLRKNEK